MHNQKFRSYPFAMLKFETHYDPFGAVPPDKSMFESLLVGENLVDLSYVQNLENIKNLQCLRIGSSSKISMDDLLRIVREGSCLRELSLSYSLLNEELLKSISTNSDISLETMRIEVHPEPKPLARIGSEAWLTLVSHSPNLNLILTSYLSEEEDYDAFLTGTTPITHLYLGGSSQMTILRKIWENCPRLTELVISSYSPGRIDDELIVTARKCPKLSAVGLGDCELTCSALVKFVETCKERLRVLYVWETSLIEDNDFDITAVVSKVSSLLGRSWVPEYVPPW